MANERNKRILYGYDGMAAYDIYRNQTAPQIQRPELPDEQIRPVKKKKIRAKTVVSPFAFLGMTAAACMLVLVIFGYVQLYEATSQVGALQTQLDNLVEEQTSLQSTYEGKIDLANIEQRAAELGMSQPGTGQLIYLNLTGSDKAEIFTEEKHNIVQEVIQAIKNSVSDLVAYLS